VAGAPLIVDPGSYAYTGDVTARNDFRSTRAHNTPMLDDYEINEVMGLWQLADQAQAQIDRHQETETGAVAAGHHVGYSRVDPPAIVAREVQLGAANCAIRDSVATGSGRWTVRWTFAPGTVVGTVSKDEATVSRGAETYRISFAGVSAVTANETWVSPSYGVRHSALCLDVKIASDHSETIIHAP
jgi:hypothetical protein